MMDREVGYRWIVQPAKERVVNNAKENTEREVNEEKEKMYHVK